MSTAKRDLTQGPVARALWRVSAPMTIGIAGVLSVGLADATFLARAGADDLAAIGFVYPAIVALTSLAIGMGAGTSAVVSQELGRTGGSEAQSARLALQALIFAAILAIVAATAFWLAAPFVFAAMGAEGAVLDKVLAYVPWWCLSFAPMVAGMGLNAVFRAGGESQIAATVMISQSVINVALDPIFIFGWGPVPALGTEGAGIATCIARVLGFGGLLVFAIASGRLSVDRACLKGLGQSLRRIARIGGPAALSNAINPLGLSFVTAAVATLGEVAVAGFGAATRVQSLLFLPMLALSAGIGPVVGQAWGADRPARAQAATRLTFFLCAGYGAALATALMLFADPLARLVANDGDAAPYAAQYLRVVGLGFFGYGILVTGNAALNARDRAVHAMGLSAARIALVYVPLAWLGVWGLGYGGVLAAALAANIAGAAGAVWLTWRTGLLHFQRPEPVALSQSN